LVPSSGGKGPAWKKYRDYGRDAAAFGLLSVLYPVRVRVDSETQTQPSSTVSASVEIEETFPAQQGYPTLYPKTAWRLDLPPKSQLLGSPLSRRAQKATVHIVRRMHLDNINGYIREECTTGPLDDCTLECTRASSGPAHFGPGKAQPRMWSNTFSKSLLEGKTSCLPDLKPHDDLECCHHGRNTTAAVHP
jgi:hypothetical protein